MTEDSRPPLTRLVKLGFLLLGLGLVVKVGVGLLSGSDVASSWAGGSLGFLGMVTLLVDWLLQRRHKRAAHVG